MAGEEGVFRPKHATAQTIIAATGTKSANPYILASYNLAYAIFGGLTPIVVAWLLRFDRLAPAHYVGALCLLGSGIGVFLVGQVSTDKIVKDD